MRWQTDATGGASVQARRTHSNSCPQVQTSDGLYETGYSGQSMTESRWRTVESIKSRRGGNGIVDCVEDATGAFTGKFARKRLRSEYFEQRYDRFKREAERLLGVLNRRLDEAPFLGGEAYSIADIAAYTWTMAATTMLADILGPALNSADSIHRWLGMLGTRQAVQRGMTIPLGA